MGRPLFVGGTPGRTGKISGCCNNLDPRTPGRVALSRDHAAGIMPPGPQRRSFQAHPRYIRRKRRWQSIFSPETRHKGPSRFPGLSRVPPKKGKTERRPRDARSRVSCSSSIFLMRARARAGVEWPRAHWMFFKNCRMKDEEGEREKAPGTGWLCALITAGNRWWHAHSTPESIFLTTCPRDNLC